MAIPLGGLRWETSGWKGESRGEKWVREYEYDGRVGTDKRLMASFQAAG